MTFPNIEPLEARIAPATISISGATVSEGNSGTSPVNFTVSLSEAATEQITVHFSTLDGTAVSTGSFADYQAQTDTVVTFEIGEMTKDVPVQVIGDDRVESDETFTATISNPSGTHTIGTATATATIANDGDSAPVITIANAPDVIEGAGVESKFTISLSHPSETDVTVTFTTGAAADTAKPSPGAFTDYIAKTTTVTFTAGTTTQEVPVSLIDDIYQEDAEQFTATLSNPSGATLGAASTAIGKILNDTDNIIGLHLDDVKHVEGNTNNTVTLTPTLSGKLATDLTLKLTTQNGTAVAGSDFTGVTLSPVTITAGQLSKTFEIAVKGDTTFEATENFFVNLTDATGVTVVNDHVTGSGAQATARVYLYNDDVQNLGPNKAQWIDVDGDLVTMTVSKGTLPLGNTNLFTFDTTTSTVGGRILQKLDLATFRTTFFGTSITITATKQAGFPDASDGRVDVGFIQAATFVPSELQVIGMDLGTVTIDGDLAQISAGDQFATSAIGKLDVYSLGAKTSTLVGGTSATLPQSDVLGPIGTVNVKTDLAGFLHIVGAEFGTIGTLKIGGALKGGALENSGRVSVSGRIGNATIGSIEGGAGTSSGFLSGTELTNGSLGTVKVLGNVTGGSGGSSGRIEGTRIGSVTAGSIIGGTGDQSGLVLARATLGNVTLSGDLLGGSKPSSGEIFSGTTIGAIKIAGKIIGGAGDDSGSIQSGGNVTSLSAGMISGGSGKGSGSVRVSVDSTGAAITSSGNIGAVNIGKDASYDSLKGGSGVNSGRIDVLGSILNFTAAGNVQGGTAAGTGELISKSTIGAIKIGRLTGNSGDDSGSIQSAGNVTSLSVGVISGGIGKGSGSVRVGVDDGGAVTKAGASIGAVTIVEWEVGTHDSLKGGTGVNSGRIDIAGNALSFTSTGDVHGGSGNGSGAIVAQGNIDKLVITGKLEGGDSAADALNTSGAIKASWLKSVSITEGIFAGKKTGAGTITSSGAIVANRLDFLTAGALTGDATNPVFISATGLLNDLAIQSINITGAVERAEIRAGYNETGATSADASIGTVVFGWTVHALDLIAGAAAGPDGRFGTADDVVATGSVRNNATVISKIASVVFKNSAAITANTVDFGISAQNVATVTLGATKIALHAGAGNDRTPIEIGGATNFSVVELAVP